MPITTTKTITDNEGNVYPYLLLNLAISSLEKETEVGGSVAMRLTPYRQNETGAIIKLDEQAQSVVFYDVFKEVQTEPVLGQVVGTIMGAIQAFINNKGL